MRTYAGRLSTPDTSSVCGRMLTHPDVCGRMLADYRQSAARHVLRMLTYADVCGRMLADYRQSAARHVLRMLTHPDVCGRMLADYRQSAARHVLDLSARADRASRCHHQHSARAPGGRHNCYARPLCVVWEAHSVWRAGVCEMRLSYLMLVYSSILINISILILILIY